ncbi:MAG: aldo/keto reductase [Gammaproteobacteria bacterium]|nr:aldo/keto reductase [Gammaproteobacteria bacterium]
MEYRKLGNTDLEVSAFCLGTMTFGGQNSAAEAHAQLDRACDTGLNLIDTAEMYPGPAREATYGESERIVGAWLEQRGGRDRIVLATKAAGPGAFVPWIRDGRSVHTAENLKRAVDASLVRLKTDYIDLFQLHWPDRAANFFGQLGFKPARNEQAFSIEETLYALDDIVRSGKIRYVGLSNETPWGMMEFLRIAGAQGLPRIASIQNPYNLLNRSFEVGGAEIAHRERLSLLAYSPLGSGTLSGKYLEDRVPADARLTFFGRHDRYSNAAARAATRRYVEIASAAAIDPAHMALAFVASKPFVSSVIIGASSIAQLDHNLKASGLELPRELLKAIDAVHEEISNPCP